MNVSCVPVRLRISRIVRAAHGLSRSLILESDTGSGSRRAGERKRWQMLQTLARRRHAWSPRPHFWSHPTDPGENTGSAARVTAEKSAGRACSCSLMLARSHSSLPARTPPCGDRTASASAAPPHRPLRGEPAHARSCSLMFAHARTPPSHPARTAPPRTRFLSIRAPGKSPGPRHQPAPPTAPT